MSSHIKTLDDSGAKAIIATGEFFSSANPLIRGIEKLKNLPIDEKKEVDGRIPSPFDWIKDGVAAFGSYHEKVLQRTSRWSFEVRDAVNWTFAQILHPLSFCKIGRAIQHSLSYDILGSIAQCIAFCAFQFFHLIPYVIVSILTAGTVTLYQTNTVALTAILAGGMLTTQLWFIYRLVKTVEAANKVWVQKADDFIAAINLVQIARSTFWSGCDLAARGIRWTASWIPTGQRQSQPQQAPAKIPIAR